MRLNPTQPSASGAAALSSRLLDGWPSTPAWLAASPGDKAPEEDTKADEEPNDADARGNLSPPIAAEGAGPAGGAAATGGQGGDPEEEEEDSGGGSLIVSYLADVTSYCYSRLGDWGMTADAAEETLVNVVRAEHRCPTDEGDDAVRAWIFKIAQGVCIDVLRRRAVALESETSSPQIERRSGERRAISTEQASAMRRAQPREPEDDSARLVAQLEEPGRSIVKMRLWDSRSFEEISKAFGKTVPSIVSIYHLSLKKLQKLIAERGPGG